MYKVIMVSPSGTERDFQGGFNSGNEASEFAKESNYRYVDENGFEWRLEVVDEEPNRMGIIIPEIKWAETFLEFRQNGDDQALIYLMDVMENSFNRYMRLKYAPIRRLVDACYALNYIVAMMEHDEIPQYQEIEEAYRNLMNLLTRSAEKPSETV